MRLNILDNTVDTIVDETTKTIDPLAADEGKGMLKCTWRGILDENLKGIGTSFPDRPIPQNEKCWPCNGYETECDLYLPSLPGKYGND